jgi:hypothetical protein
VTAANGNRQQRAETRAKPAVSRRDGNVAIGVGQRAGDVIGVTHDLGPRPPIEFLVHGVLADCILALFNADNGAVLGAVLL